MLGVKRILCPTDFSPYSIRARAHAVSLARWTGASLVFLHAVPFIQAPPTAALPVAMPPAPLDAAARERIAAELDAFAAPAEAARVQVVKQVVEGEPVAEILAAAESGGADLIVMGTHGTRGFERLVLGSVTEKVLRKSPCPVVTVPRDEEEPAGTLFGPIVCPVDFSGCSFGALRAAQEIASETGGRLLLLHVLDWLPAEDPRSIAHAPFPDHRERGERDAQASLERLLRDADPAPERVVRGGRPYQEIVRLAHERRAGLIVMGVQGRGAIDLMLFGSTTHHVIREARCPVLTVREAVPIARGLEAEAVTTAKP